MYALGFGELWLLAEALLDYELCWIWFIPTMIKCMHLDLANSYYVRKRCWIWDYFEFDLYPSDFLSVKLDPQVVTTTTGTIYGWSRWDLRGSICIVG